MNRTGRLLGVLLVLILAAAGCGSTTVELPHVHGMGYSADGTRLIVAAHDGLRHYAGGRWSIPDVPRHDYMGYSPTSDGFYSSGHPGPGSKLPNPLGLVKSVDEGKSLATLGFQGESDFHLMAVGYRTHAAYVLNPAPNSRLGVGLHYTLDDGKTWQQAAARGAEGRPLALAVHPTRPEFVVMGTEAGLFFSEDHGASFQMRLGGPVTATTFSPGGERLLFGGEKFYTYEVATTGLRTFPGPAEGKDFIAYIAANPARPDEVAVATAREVNLYLSTDGGRAWKAIAQKGKGKGGG